MFAESSFGLQQRRVQVFPFIFRWGRNIFLRGRFFSDNLKFCLSPKKILLLRHNTQGGGAEYFIMISFSFFYMGQKHTIFNLIKGIFRVGHMPPLFWFSSGICSLCYTAGHASGLQQNNKWGICRIFTSINHKKIIAPKGPYSKKRICLVSPNLSKIYNSNFGR